MKSTLDISHYRGKWLLTITLDNHIHMINVGLGNLISGVADLFRYRKIYGYSM
jgi:hypothetical protein